MFTNVEEIIYDEIQPIYGCTIHLCTRSYVEVTRKSHAVIRLAVHLPNEQLVYFHEGEEATAALRAENRNTHLTA